MSPACRQRHRRRFVVGSIVLCAIAVYLPSAAPASAAVRPYDDASAWNTPIGRDAPLDALSSRYVNAIADNGKPLTSDPDQYAVSVYLFNDTTPRRPVTLDAFFSSYDAGDDSRVGHGFAPTLQDVPIPNGITAPDGSDGQVVIWNPTTGVEYSFWRFQTDANGNHTATNGSRYRTTPGNHGRFADGKSGRGAGTPYLAGLIRPWEINQGRIDHALAFAYDSPAPEHVYPASKSDGAGITGTDPPEGARLQLDPTLTDTDLTAWGLNPTAKIIAKALQTYGMYIIDNSGSSKIYLEARNTAHWNPTITRNTVSNIPWKHFRVIKPPAS